MRLFTFAADTHKANLEIHATGCRDLAHLPAGTTTWEVVAPTAKQAVRDAELPGVKINACCNLKRMDAAGRGPVVAPAPDPVDVGLAAVAALLAGEPVNPLDPDQQDAVAEIFTPDAELAIAE